MTPLQKNTNHEEVMMENVPTKKANQPSVSNNSKVSRMPSSLRKRKQPSFRGFPDVCDLRLTKYPILTIRHFNAAVLAAWKRVTLPSCLSSRKSSIILAALITAVIALISSGPEEETPQWKVALVDALWWFFCGVLSTIGLGTGVQTGALFLFPHVARIALEKARAEAATSSNFDNMWWSSLLWEAAVPGFWAGTGSAVGELVPFVLARGIRAAGGDPFTLLNSDEEGEASDNGMTSSSWTPRVFLANTRSAMERQLSSGSFLKIFILAAIPNALFDLCGLVCGATNAVPFSTFFLAVWTAKAFVRTPLQTCGLAFAVASIIASGPDKIDGTEGAFRLAMKKWGHSAITQLVDSNSPENISGFGFVDVVKLLWTALTVGLFAMFLLSTIEQIAQHNARAEKNMKSKW